MRKEVYIHLGLPKTATTFLQKYIFSKYDGVSYCSTRYGEEDSFSETLAFERTLMFFGVPFWDIEGTKAKLQNEIQRIPNDKILISREGFAGTAADNFRSTSGFAYLLKEVFVEPRVIFVFRKQEDWLISIFRQAVRAKMNQSAEDFFNFRGGQFEPPLSPVPIGLDVLNLDWCNFILFYNRLFGDRNVLALPFELFQQNPTTFVDKMSEFIGVTSPGFDAGEKVNARDGAAFYAAQAVINRLFSKQRRGRYRKLLNLLKHIDGEVWSPLPREAIETIKENRSKWTKPLSELCRIDLTQIGY
jgi:hypothetical protein